MAIANVTWTASAGATSYRVEYKLQSTGVWTLHNASVTGTSTSISGLIDGASYDFRVISNCASGTSSGSIQSGTTACLDVSGLSASISGTTANLSWNRKTDAVSYAIEYKLQADSSWTVASGSPLSNPGSGSTVTFGITGLSAGAAYDFRVKINCQVGTSSGVVVQATSSCPNVTNLNVTFS